MGSQISDLRSQISNLKPQTIGLGLDQTNHEPQTTNHEPPTTSSARKIINKRRTTVRKIRLFLAPALAVAVAVALAGCKAEEDKKGKAQTPEKEKIGKSDPQVVASAEQAPADLVWHEDFGEARKAALDQKKPVLADCWADWCKPCKTLFAKVLTHESLRDRMSKFSLAKIDTMKESNAAFVQKHGIEFDLPWVGFFTSQGEIVPELSLFGDAAKVPFGSPEAFANPKRTASPFPFPVWRYNLHKRFGLPAIAFSMHSKLLSLECPSTKINSVLDPISGVRLKICWILPASLRTGTITDTTGA